MEKLDDQVKVTLPTIPAYKCKNFNIFVSQTPRNFWVWMVWISDKIRKTTTKWREMAKFRKLQEKVKLSQIKKPEKFYNESNER